VQIPIKIGGIIFDLASVDLIDLNHNRAAPGLQSVEIVVRFQYKNRHDEVVNVAGRPSHIKHGVYELPPAESEKFRWWLQWFGSKIGINDIDLLYANREQIEKAITKMRAASEPIKNPEENPN
jgi:hypothetical protein